MAMSGVWSWKEEPASPLIQLEADSWFNTSDNVPIEVELTDEVKVSRAEHASKMLEDLDQWKIEEEAFPDWLEEKINLPILDDLPPSPSALVNSLDMIEPRLKPTVNSNLDMVAIKNSHININNPAMDIGMKEAIGNAAIDMMKHHDRIVYVNPMQYQVPPPPQSQQTNIAMDQTPVSVQELLQQEYTLPSTTAPAADTLTPPDSPREADLAFTMMQVLEPHELDELVRMRVELMEESPAESQCESESVASPSTSDSCYSDPEWTMPSVSEVKTSKKRRMVKPYTRTPPEEKKLRKKEQNKNAATRYRLKKKQEIEEILEEEKQLQQKNEQLKTELTDLGREIKYLKNLMRELFKAKGLIK